MLIIPILGKQRQEDHKPEQVLPGSEGDMEEREGAGDRERNDPNNVCTCEYMNKEKKRDSQAYGQPGLHSETLLQKN
jgi:hypothetical protein